MQRIVIVAALLGVGLPTAASAEAPQAASTSVDDGRIQVIATLGDSSQPATPRASAAMRELIAERLVVYDAEHLELAPQHVQLRVAIVEEPGGTQGFYGVLRLQRGDVHVERELSCSRCGGSGFLAALITELDVQAVRLRAAARRAPTEHTPASLPPTTSPIPNAQHRPARWTWSWFGWTGLMLSATGVVSAAAGAGCLGYAATHRDSAASSMDVGVILLGIGAAALAIGVPPLAIELHRLRKHRRRTTVSLAPLGTRHAWGIAVGVRLP